MRMMKAAANFFNSNAGAQIVGAVSVGVATYFAGRMERDGEFLELREKIVKANKINDDYSEKIGRLSEQIDQHLLRENRDAIKILELKIQYNRCLVQRDMVHSAFSNSFCIIRSKLAPDFLIDSDEKFPKGNSNKC